MPGTGECARRDEPGASVEPSSVSFQSGTSAPGRSRNAAPEGSAAPISNLAASGKVEPSSVPQYVEAYPMGRGPHASPEGSAAPIAIAAARANPLASGKHLPHSEGVL